MARTFPRAMEPMICVPREQFQFGPSSKDHDYDYYYYSIMKMMDYNDILALDDSNDCFQNYNVHVVMNHDPNLNHDGSK